MQNTNNSSIESDRELTEVAREQLPLAVRDGQLDPDRAAVQLLAVLYDDQGLNSPEGLRRLTACNKALLDADHGEIKRRLAGQVQVLQGLFERLVMEATKQMEQNRPAAAAEYMRSAMAVQRTQLQTVAVLAAAKATPALT